MSDAAATASRDADQGAEPPVASLSPWLRALLVAPAAAGIPMMVSGGYVARTLGVALCLLGAYAVVPELAAALRALYARPPRLRGRELGWLPQMLPAVALFGVAAALLWPVLIGQMPQSQDHPVHLTRAWHFVSEMLGQGRLSGWSDLWFAGWPAGEDYPPGGDLWISTLYLATFGLLGWEATYGLAFLAVFAVGGLAVYHFGKTYFGRTAGLLAGLFFMLDRGQYREGGWTYTVWWGVWPQVLSTAFTLLAFSTLDQVLRRGKPRDHAICGLCAGFALLAHPVAIIYFGIGVPIYLAARTLGTDEPAGRVIARTLGALTLGAALAAFWLLPFSAKSAWMAKYGELWKSLPQMAQGMLRGTRFDNITPPLVWLGLLGGGLAAWRRSFAGLFLVGLGAVVLFLASSTAFHELDLISISPAFGQVQFQRLAIPVKVCLLLLAGYALQVAFTRIAGEVARPAFSWRRYLLTALVMLSVAPFVEPALRAWGKTYGAEVGRIRTRKDLRHWDDYQRFLSWSKELGERQGKKPQELVRIAYVRPYNDHFFAAAPVYNHLPAYKVGFTPCTNFIHKPDTADPNLYRMLQVKYVVSIGTQRGRDLRLAKRFGAIHVYENLGYSPKRYTLIGPGTVKVAAFEPERVRLVVSGAGPDSRLVLHRANYPNWSATVDGRPLPIETAALETHNIFIGVPAKNGTIELRYRWPAVNVVGSLISWAAIGLLLLMVACRYRPALAERLAERLLPLGRRAERHGLWIGVGLVALALIGLTAKAATRGGSKDDARSLLSKLDRAVVELERGGRRTPCPRQRDRFVCSKSHSWNFVGPVSHRIDGQFRRCLWAHPVDGGKLQVRFGKIELGRALVGHHGLLDDAVRSHPTGAPVQLEVAVEGGERRAFTRPNGLGWAHFRLDTQKLAGKRADVTFTVTARRAGGRHYCFEASIEK